MFPELEKPFIHMPDKSGQHMPDASALREMLMNSSEGLTDLFLKMDAEEWTTKHALVSDEEFEKEPHRNKLNVLLGRTSHQAYHMGQMALLEL